MKVPAAIVMLLTATATALVAQPPTDRRAITSVARDVELHDVNIKRQEDSGPDEADSAAPLERPSEDALTTIQDTGAETGSEGENTAEDLVSDFEDTGVEETGSEAENTDEELVSQAEDQRQQLAAEGGAGLRIGVGPLDITASGDASIQKRGLLDGLLGDLGSSLVDTTSDVKAAAKPPVDNLTSTEDADAETGSAAENTNEEVISQAEDDSAGPSEEAVQGTSTLLENSDEEVISKAEDKRQLLETSGSGSGGGAQFSIDVGLLEATASGGVSEDAFVDKRRQLDGLLNGLGLALVDTTSDPKAATKRSEDASINKRILLDGLLDNLGLALVDTTSDVKAAAKPSVDASAGVGKTAVDAGSHAAPEKRQQALEGGLSLVIDSDLVIDSNFAIDDAIGESDPGRETSSRKRRQLGGLLGGLKGATKGLTSSLPVVGGLATHV